MRVASIAFGTILSLGASSLAIASAENPATTPSQEDRQKIIKEVSEKREKIDVNSIRQGTVVAKVLDEKVTVEEVAKAIQNIPQQMRQMPFDFIFRAALDQVIDYKILQKASEKERKSLEEQPEVKEAIKKAVEQVILKAYMDDVVQTQMTEKKIRARYAELVKKFPKDSHETKVRQILVSDIKTANEILQSLKDGGDFLRLAREKSTDKATAEKDGELGYLNVLQAKEIPELSILFEKDKNGKFVVPAGSFTKEPIAIKAGDKVIAYAIFKVDDRRPFNPPKYEEIKPALKNQISQEILAEKTKELRKKSNVERYHPNSGKPMPAFEDELKELSKEIDTKMKALTPGKSAASAAQAPTSK